MRTADQIFLDPKDVKRALKELNAIDKNIVKTMRKDLKTQLAGVRADVRKAHPRKIGRSQLRGFNNNGPTRWTGVRSSVVFTTQAKKLKARGWTSIVAIEIAPSPKDARGIYIAELAGSVTNGVTQSGRALIQRLNEIQPMRGRGGRFFYDRFRKNRKQAVYIAEKILRNFMKRVERNL